MDIKKLRREQVHSKLEQLKEYSQLFRGVSSWAEYVRKALGMSIEQLAQRMGLSPATLYQSQRLEKEDRITIKKLREIGDAMNCDLVYAFVPRTSIKEYIREQAIKKASQIVHRTHGHMELEDQALSENKINEQIKDLADSLMDDKALWDSE